MSQIASAVTDIGMKIFTGIGDNTRKNEKADFQRYQAELLAAYQRDQQTTLTFQDWALQNEAQVQKFQQQNAGAGNSNYLIASGILLVGGVVFFVFYNSDEKK